MHYLHLTRHQTLDVHWCGVTGEWGMPVEHFVNMIMTFEEQFFGGGMMK